MLPASSPSVLSSSTWPYEMAYTKAAHRREGETGCASTPRTLRYNAKCSDREHCREGAGVCPALSVMPGARQVPTWINPIIRLERAGVQDRAGGGCTTPYGGLPGANLSDSTGRQPRVFGTYVGNASKGEPHDELNTRELNVKNRQARDLFGKLVHDTADCYRDKGEVWISTSTNLRPTNDQLRLYRCNSTVPFLAAQ